MSRTRLLFAAALLLLLGGALLIVGLLRIGDGDQGNGGATPASTSTTLIQESLPGAAEIRRGDLEAARDVIGRHLEQNPEDSQARYLLALTFEREGDVDGALEVYAALLEVDPTDFEAYYRIGVLQRQTGDLQAAADSFEQSLQINSDFAAARVALAEVKAELADPEGAIELYFQVIEQRPMGVHLDEIRVPLARLLVQVEQTDNAEIQLNRALVENPGNTAARELLDELEGRGGTTTTGAPVQTTTTSS